MALRIEPMEPDGLPKPQAVRIGTICDGEVKPTGRSPDRWHASINSPRGSATGYGYGWLLQGFGKTPEAAVGDAIIAARADNDRRAADLAKIEAECGTTGLSDDDVRALFAPATEPPAFDESDCGGAFDGVSVSSDADPGL